MPTVCRRSCNTISNRSADRKHRCHEDSDRKGNHRADDAAGDLVGVDGRVVARTGRVADSGPAAPHFRPCDRSGDTDADFAAVVADHSVRAAGRKAFGQPEQTADSLHGADYLFRQRAILPFCRRNDFADRRQLHPRHRGRHGHSPFDRTGSRLFLRPAARPAARDQLGDQQRNARTGHVADRLAGNDRLALSFLGLSAARRFAAADTYSEKSALAGCDIRFRSGSFSGSRRRVRCGRFCGRASGFRLFRRRLAFAIVRRGPAGACRCGSTSGTSGRERNLCRSVGRLRSGRRVSGDCFPSRKQRGGAVRTR